MNISTNRYVGTCVFCILLASGLLGGHTAHAELTVCKSGCDYTDIQDAVTDASDGEIIQIQQGIFIGPVTIENKNLTLRGAGSGITIIDRGPSVNSDPPPPTIVVSCTHSNHEINISNITISGEAPFQGSGGGGLVNESCNVKLVNTLITNNARRINGNSTHNGI